MNGPVQAGLDAAQLGPAPFNCDVVVTLDGVRHTAKATWPDDEIAWSRVAESGFPVRWTGCAGGAVHRAEHGARRYCSSTSRWQHWIRWHATSS